VGDKHERLPALQVQYKRGLLALRGGVLIKVYVGRRFNFLQSGKFLKKKNLSRNKGIFGAFAISFFTSKEVRL
jgi:hypothetical protein